ncbi:MAG: hypothetical protein KME40_14620 [Komarekiella atlantica HA4396-MV6]|jgi:hypothetical protein|nr:hypothetical protein [Komarekiella atlantica HA4396-MV6]
MSQINNPEKFSIITAFILMIPLIDLLFGSGVLLNIPFIAQYKDSIFIIIALIIVLVFTFAFIYKIFGDVSNYNISLDRIFSLLFFYIVILGTIWDIVTSLYGFYRVFSWEQNDPKIHIFAGFIAIISTFICFYITLIIPKFVNGESREFYRKSINWNNTTLTLKLFTYLLFLLAFIYDFGTSLIGNAVLLGLSPNKLFTIPIIQGTMLFIGTLLVCFCQFIFFNLYQDRIDE